MQEITLLTNVDKEDDKDGDKVSLMTVHAAKGLEFKYVYIVGLEENLFPSQLSISSRSDLEEERRLFYVAITRAEKQAILSFATMRYRFGNITYCEPSRFINEIDDKYLDYPKENIQKKFSDDSFGGFRTNYLKNNKLDENALTNNEKTKAITFNPSNKKLIKINSNLSSSSSILDTKLNRNLIAGDWVLHDKFGKGQISVLEGNWPETKANILFENVGQKSLLLKFARLNKIN